MQIFHYEVADSSEGPRLAAALLAAAPGWEIEHFTRLADFRERMHAFVEPDSIAVLAAANASELREMQDLGDLIQDIGIILVLPDWQDSTLRQAHHLRPRFCCEKNDSYTGLHQIVRKMVQASH
jgi:hypothetical protein